MCWNETVSLNTFLFSMGALLLIMYNNAYTKYKIEELNNVWVYLFFASFISMQLVEFFIWRNIDNKYYNHIFSIIGVFVLFSQPIFSLMMLQNIKLRNWMLATYSLGLPYVIYKVLTSDIYSERSENGHLRWIFVKTPTVLFALWIFFFIFSLMYNKHFFEGGIALGLLGMSMYKYEKQGTYTSMWCWISNSIMIYYTIYLLIVLPFLEKGCIC